jgi:hypothetical protein
MSQRLDFRLRCHVEVDRPGGLGRAFLLFLPFRLAEAGPAGGIRGLDLPFQS